MNAMHKITALLLSTILLVTSCVGGGSSGGGGSSDGTKTPGNLKTTVTDINSSGDVKINFTNSGDLPVIIKDEIKLFNPGTVDEIKDIEKCKQKTLSNKQSCEITLNVKAGEALDDIITIDTNNGKYKFTIRVNTSSEGVFDNDIKELNTTKPQTIQIHNKGALPVTIKSISLDKSNDDDNLIIKDVNCVNTLLDPGSYCEIMATASPGLNKQHTILIDTSNLLIATQKLLLYEVTDKNSLQITQGPQVISPEITITKPGHITYTIYNNGSNDIHIQSITMPNNNIGTINPQDNHCNNKMLQAEDECTFGVDISNNAHGSGVITLYTSEKLLTPNQYHVNITTPNLTITEDNGTTDDILIHTTATKQVTILNDSDFYIDINKDGMKYDTGKVFINNNCEGKTINPHSTCEATLITSTQEDDNSKITFHEYGGDDTQKTINLHINNGIIVTQPTDAQYTNHLPHDNNFYQVFVINNPTQYDTHLLNPALMLRDSKSTHVVLSKDVPDNVFYKPNCYTNDNKLNILSNSICEIILQEPNDWNTLQEMINDKDTHSTGHNFMFSVNYAPSHDIYTKNFQGVVNYHHIQEKSTYQPYEVLLPNTAISPNSCHFPTPGALILSDIPLAGARVFSMGVYLSAGADATTIKIDTFMDVWDTCRLTTRYFVAQNNQMILKDANNNIVSQQNFPTANAITYGGDSNFNSVINSNVNCDGSFCSIPISINPTDPLIKARVTGTLTFKQPYPAKDYDVVDTIIWDDIPSLSAKGTH